MRALAVLAVLAAATAGCGDGGGAVEGGAPTTVPAATTAATTGQRDRDPPRVQEEGGAAPTTAGRLGDDQPPGSSPPASHSPGSTAPPGTSPPPPTSSAPVSTSPGVGASELRAESRCAGTPPAPVTDFWWNPTGRGPQRVDLTALSDGFATGRYETVATLPADAATFRLDGPDGEAKHHWRVLTQEGERWISSEVATFQAPGCVGADQR